MSTSPDSFFRSRWVDRPAGVTELDPDELPNGFRAAGLACGIKPSGNADVGLIACDSEAPASAARFTRNAIVAAPVTVSRRAQLGALRAVVVNSGNANVSDGARGLATAEVMVARTADALGVDPDSVAVASTGVIGHQLDRERVVAGIEQAASKLSSPGAIGFADAIMTTDRWPKRASLDIELSAGTIRLCGQAKGGGMIRPNFATLLAFIETDVAIEPDELDRLLGDAVSGTFDCISVDGQLSTNDSVFVIASGASGVALDAGSEDEQRFVAAFEALLMQLALEIVADGEGGSRVARVRVRGGSSSIEPVARAVATSPLVQTALAGGDPNWGRIIQAAGAAMPDDIEPEIDLSIEDMLLARESDAVELDAGQQARVAQAMKRPEVEIEIKLPKAEYSFDLYFCDIGHDYVTLNSEYTT